MNIRTLTIGEIRQVRARRSFSRCHYKHLRQRPAHGGACPKHGPHTGLSRGIAIKGAVKRAGRDVEYIKVGIWFRSVQHRVRRCRILLRKAKRGICLKRDPARPARHTGNSIWALRWRPGGLLQVVPTPISDLPVKFRIGSSGNANHATCADLRYFDNTAIRRGGDCRRGSGDWWCYVAGGGAGG